MITPEFCHTPQSTTPETSGTSASDEARIMTPDTQSMVDFLTPSSAMNKSTPLLPEFDNEISNMLLKNINEILRGSSETVQAQNPKKKAPRNPGSNKSNRPNRHLPWQTEILEKKFQALIVEPSRNCSINQILISMVQRQEIAQMTMLTNAQVIRWFSKRKAKEKARILAENMTRSSRNLTDTNVVSDQVSTITSNLARGLAEGSSTPDKNLNNVDGEVQILEQQSTALNGHATSSSSGQEMAALSQNLNVTEKPPSHPPLSLSVPTYTFQESGLPSVTVRNFLRSSMASSSLATRPPSGTEKSMPGIVQDHDDGRNYMATPTLTPTIQMPLSLNIDTLMQDVPAGRLNSTPSSSGSGETISTMMSATPSLDANFSPCTSQLPDPEIVGSSPTVNILVGGRTFTIEKAALTEISRYFTMLFHSHRKERAGFLIELKGVQPEEFEIFLNAVFYENTFQANDLNIEPLLKLSSRFEIMNFVKKCEAYLIISPTMPPIFKLMLADQYDLMNLMNWCLNSVKTREDFNYIVRSEEHKSCSENLRARLYEKLVTILFRA